MRIAAGMVFVIGSAISAILIDGGHPFFGSSVAFMIGLVVGQLL